MAERNTAEATDRWIEFRVGIHQGDIVVVDGDILGDIFPVSEVQAISAARRPAPYSRNFLAAAAARPLTLPSPTRGEGLAPLRAASVRTD